LLDGVAQGVAEHGALAALGGGGGLAGLGAGAGGEDGADQSRVVQAADRRGGPLIVNIDRDDGLMPIISRR